MGQFKLIMIFMKPRISSNLMHLYTMHQSITLMSIQFLKLHIMLNLMPTKKLI